MKLCDLTNEQRLELKQAIVEDRNEHIGEGTSYEELANADDLVSDEDLEARHEGEEFSVDDFSCGVAADRDGVLDELKEWAERELTYDKFKASQVREDACLMWALEKLLDHIKAVRS